MTTLARHKIKRVLGIVRVSEVGDRQPDNLYSPTDQADRIAEACERDGLNLLQTFEEIDVSGGSPISKRVGLKAAIEAIEAGEADVLMVAYFDRLVRSLKVQQEITERVEAAGGEVLTLDFGKLTNGTAVQRLTANFLGSVSQYYREQTAEKSAEGQRHAIEAGKFTGPTVPAGFLKGPDGRLQPDPATRKIAHEAFERRAAGATTAEVKMFLAEHGIKRTITGVRVMLSNRVYIGEIHFGKLHNLDAHKGIIERDLFAAVQRMFVRAGRNTKSDRLLARLDILHCGSCGGRMSASISGSGYGFYRCATSKECPHPQTITAKRIENFVIDKVKELRADLQGRAAANEHYEHAIAMRDRTQAKLERLIMALADLEDEVATVEVLAKTKAERDRWQAEVDRLQPARASLEIDANLVWEHATLLERRGLILATIKSITVGPGRSVDERVRIEPLS